jgi:Na+-transporting NADH:ubiquinone oxidoreductase subunit NqrA
MRSKGKAIWRIAGGLALRPPGRPVNTLTDAAPAPTGHAPADQLRPATARALGADELVDGPAGNWLGENIRSALIGQRAIRRIIVPLGRSEPWLADPLVALRDRGPIAAAALAALARTLDVRDVLLAVPPGVDEAPGLNALLAAQPAEKRIVLGSYPAFTPPMLARLSARSLDPSANDDLLVLDAQVLVAVGQVLAGRVPDSVVIALSGPLANRPRHLRVLLGTPLRELVDGELAPASRGRSHGEVRIIRGGLLTGEQLDAEALDTPVTASDRGLALLDRRAGRLTGRKAPRPSRTSPCIGCGRCGAVCPVRIAPYQHHRFAMRDLTDEAEQMGIDRCIECGLCTYVCPSRIDLRGDIRSLKLMLAAERSEQP